jgi:hypothetical protein
MSEQSFIMAGAGPAGPATSLDDLAPHIVAAL